ncbi:hypothetical protein L596_030883 [Steinernema carpocapsae]|uniref:Uncharacterized protein n=2 Tax=Steinernema carpocapsae TaxID=34508 RepID=A0A4U5LNH8_STECR|nr:hypothetical protein L596_030883 [Steinernema carpocapsae]
MCHQFRLQTCVFYKHFVDTRTTETMCSIPQGSDTANLPPCLQLFGSPYRPSAAEIHSLNMFPQGFYNQQLQLQYTKLMQQKILSQLQQAQQRSLGIPFASLSPTSSNQSMEWSSPIKRAEYDEEGNGICPLCSTKLLDPEEWTLHVQQERDNLSKIFQSVCHKKTNGFDVVSLTKSPSRKRHMREDEVERIKGNQKRRRETIKIWNYIRDTPTPSSVHLSDQLGSQASTPMPNLSECNSQSESI